MNAEDAVLAVVRCFANLAVVVRDETELQVAVARTLVKHGVPFVEQAQVHGPLGESLGRIDFMCGRVGLELKTKGGLSPLLRQLDRYASSPQIIALVMITTRRMLARLPAQLRSKPVVSVVVGSL